MTELGTIVKGSEIGKIGRTKFIWVDCPAKIVPDCSGARWGRYRETSGQSRVRLCAPCNRRQTSNAFNIREWA